LERDLDLEMPDGVAEMTALLLGSALRCFSFESAPALVSHASP